MRWCTANGAPHTNRKPPVVANSKRVVKILIGLLERGRQKVRLPGLLTSSKPACFRRALPKDLEKVPLWWAKLLLLA